MNNTPTPETDAAKWTAARYSANDYVQVVDASVAAKLEQERDEARAKLHYPSHELYVNVLRENDQLRRVADEVLLNLKLIKKNNQGGYVGDARLRDECIDKLNSLPHVIAAKKGNVV